MSGFDNESQRDELGRPQPWEVEAEDSPEPSVERFCQVLDDLRKLQETAVRPHDFQRVSAEIDKKRLWLALAYQSLTLRVKASSVPEPERTSPWIPAKIIPATARLKEKP